MEIEELTEEKPLSVNTSGKFSFTEKMASSKSQAKQIVNLTHKTIKMSSKTSS